MGVEGSSYFLSSGVLYLEAKKAYERTKSAPSDIECNQNDALTALLFSAATLEAFIAELAFHAQTSVRLFPTLSPVQALASALKEVEASRGSVRLKYIVAKAVLSGDTYDKGTQPYQDFDLLIRIRDSIVHLKPERITQEPHKIVSALMAKGLCDRVDPHVKSSWVYQITTRAVARWACNVVRDMVNSLRECFPECAEKTVNPFMIIAFGSSHFKGVD